VSPQIECEQLGFSVGRARTDRGMIWTSRGFVYDESDEVLRAPSLQSIG
jgi:hypothetical protein